MKKNLGLLVLTVYSVAAFGAKLELPWTMDAGSVQAKLKQILYTKLQETGPQEEEYLARLTGGYGEVVLEDEASRIACREGSQGMMAVQQFSCSITTKGRSSANKIVLPTVMNSGSVQAVLKELLYETLQKNGPTTEPYEANLTGGYSEVTLEDKASKVVCREGSHGMLAVQQFGCEITTKK